MYRNGVLALSPSRASDFKACPQLFKFRTVDRLQEPFDPAALRGSLVHLALERLHRMDPRDRRPDRIDELLESGWTTLEEELEGLADDVDPSEILEASRRLMANYFRVEDPTEIHPLEVEWQVEHRGRRTLLRGIVDRLEADPEGEWVLTDYKTGRSPSESYALGSFFGLRFYALVCWRAHGKMPKALRLVHLREPEVVTLTPSEQMLEAVERQIDAIGVAVARAHATGDFRPRPSRICSWCPHQEICPAWAKGNEQSEESLTAHSA
jgi:putative RecB family exonuclease